MGENIKASKSKASPCKYPSSLWCQIQSFRCCNSTTVEIIDVDFTGKWIIITGGNSGIGREAALRFASWGANIILGCRPNPPPREPAPESVVDECKAAAKVAGKLDTEIEWWEVDMSSLASVQALGKRWLDTGRPLDILCNNAGISSAPSSQVITNDGFDLVHQINLLSHVLLTLTLLPSLAKEPGPRILCTTSNAQYFGVFDLEENANKREGSYGNNKLYFQTWLTELQARLAKSNKYKHIVIHGFHPGYAQTNIWNPETKDWGEWICMKLMPYVGISAQQGSLCIANAASSPDLAMENLKADPKDGIIGAKFMNRIWDFTPMPHTRHPECRRMVWDFVDKELKLGRKDC
ncbi:Retinol dehydrogenase [Lachnellula subtilissima]|uniref:Retinol dehydrogenase n=1 Tax=Lachnellula subtilissima TaxID=602034 RepID=A0A8H8RKY8_9HELO|nr:Retinol dehydrogenase [Lachnellula subtilissima]